MLKIQILEEVVSIHDTSGLLLMGDPRCYAVVAVCRNHLGGSDERQK
jgi:hypothetical protein